MHAIWDGNMIPTEEVECTLAFIIGVYIVDRCKSVWIDLVVHIKAIKRNLPRKPGRPHNDDRSSRDS